MQRILQNLKKPDVELRKTKNVQISIDRLFAKNLLFFFAKLVQSVSLCHRLSKKLKVIKI